MKLYDNISNISGECMGRQLEKVLDQMKNESAQPFKTQLIEKHYCDITDSYWYIHSCIKHGVALVTKNYKPIDDLCEKCLTKEMATLTIINVLNNEL